MVKANGRSQRSALISRMPVLDRRDFLTCLMAGASFRAAPVATAADLQFSFRQPGPCADLAPLVDAANDTFSGERRGMEIEEVLRNTLLWGSLPVPTGFRGPSPMPARYEDSDGVMVARYEPSDERFSEGLDRWVASVGDVRRALFHALPDDVVRFEISSESGNGLEHRVGHWRMTFRGRTLRQFEPLDETLVRAPEPLFRDVTADLFDAAPSVREHLAKGVPYWRSRLDSATGIDVYGNQGIAVGDIDGDGWDEIYVCQPGGLPNRLYSRVDDGRWLDRTEEAGLGILDNTSQALFLDLRNTGIQDLVALTSSGPLLFVNDGTGRFRHRPQAFRFDSRAKGTFAGMAAADYDRDGKVDLYLCSYIYFRSEDQYSYPAPYHDARNGPPNFLFRNRLTETGDGYFEDVTAASGMGENNDRYSFAAAWCDYDGDGWPELYVANDFGRNNLYKRIDGRYQDIAARAGVEDIGPGMSAAWFDYNRDGRLDLYVTNMWTAAGQRVAADPSFGPVRSGAAPTAYRGHTKGNSLYRNGTGEGFEYAGASEGVEMGRWSWSGDGFDFDLDGTPEILVAAGMISHSREKDLCSFFWRRVVAESPAEAIAAPGYEEGWNCLNQMVREDFSWSGHEPNVFYARRGGSYRDFSGVSGLDRAMDSRAFAVTDLDGDGRPDLLLKSRLGPQLMAFRNDSAGDRQALVIELEGTRSNRDAIGAIVRVATENGVSAQVLSAGSGYISQHTKRLHFGLGSEVVAKSVTVQWPSGEEQEFEGLEPGYRYRIQEGAPEYERFRLVPRRPAGRPRRPLPLHNFYVFEPTWLWDAVPLPEDAPEGFLFLTDGGLASPPTALPHRVVDLRAAGADKAAAFAIFRRYLFDYRTRLSLPMTMLVDNKSCARKVYPGIPPAPELQRDYEIYKGRGNPRRGLPFRGRYYGFPSRNHFQMGSAFMQAGYPQLAKPYLVEASRVAGGNFKASLAVGQIELEAGNLGEAERYLSIAQELDPDSPELWNNFGGLAMARGDHLKALENFQRALDLNPELTYALVNAAQTQSQLGNPGEAERLLRRALEVDSGDAEAANKLGLLLAKQGRMDEARWLFQQAIENKRDYAEAINNLAVLYLRSGLVSDAAAALRFGIEQVPDFETFYMHLARIHVERGDYASARDVLGALLQRKPGHEAATKALAQIQFR